MRRGNALERWLYPEMAAIRERNLVARVQREMPRRVWRTPRFFLTVAGMLGGAVLIGFMPSLLAQRFRSAGFGGIVVVGAVFGFAQGGIFALAFTVALRRPMRRFLREVLREDGEPVCLECGYSLRGLPEPRCPECGFVSPALDGDVNPVASAADPAATREAWERPLDDSGRPELLRDTRRPHDE